ncbi:hypothetical protein NPIL_603691 [Nephila pilipes]|uniref:Uncharacterized protein n=1 Tax=Nephila pilipes TaxID=299642 RepID=A0A8X6P2R4_NEPPI|nr:hypothetical protein NPIL_603691 [Nephila pilipes]
MEYRSSWLKRISPVENPVTDYDRLRQQHGMIAPHLNETGGRHSFIWIVEAIFSENINDDVENNSFNAEKILYDEIKEDLFKREWNTAESSDGL